MKKYDRESKTNKRLSMDYEELMWKMIQESGSTETVYHRQISRSPTGSGKSSPDPVAKGQSPVTTDNTEQTARRSRHSCGDDSLERKLKRRSGTFIVEPKRTSPRASPQAKRPSSEGFESSSPQSSGTCDTSAHSVSSHNTSLQSISSGEGSILDVLSSLASNTRL